MNQINRYTKPYVVEGMLAGCISIGLFLILYVIVGLIENDFVGTLFLLAIGLGIALLWDLRTFYLCMLDRVKQTVQKKTVTFEKYGSDISFVTS